MSEPTPTSNATTYLAMAFTALGALWLDRHTSMGASPLIAACFFNCVCSVVYRAWKSARANATGDELPVPPQIDWANVDLSKVRGGPMTPEEMRGLTDDMAKPWLFPPEGQ